MFSKEDALMSDQNRTYIAIDMKSYYASVECVYRHLDPLKANLLVADESRSDQTICLAVSPALKVKGVPGRCRLFEARQIIKAWETQNHTKLSYIVAAPRMAEYERISGLIYATLLKYVAPQDIHVYSIDESFIDCTHYLHHYREAAVRQQMNPAHCMAITMVRDILSVTGITATVGIGTNLYLAKVCMDIVAKKMPPDQDGVRIAELNEESYCYQLWNHRPLTDFWQIGAHIACRLEKSYLYTMGDIARKSQIDEEWFYRNFGIDAEILIDHAWGKEPVTMHDIKSYRTDTHSVSNGQVLPRPYEYEETVNIFQEMVDVLCADLYRKKLVAKTFTWGVGYDHTSLEKNPNYAGPLSIDFYGRIHPKHSNGTVRTRSLTNRFSEIQKAMLADFRENVNHALLFRRLTVCANDVKREGGLCQLNLFDDDEIREREHKLQGVMMEVRAQFGANSVFTGNNLLKGATLLERNLQIGGHRA